MTVVTNDWSISFNHTRKSNSKNNDGSLVYGGEIDFGELPIMKISSIVSDKSAVKVYVTYGTKQSFYIPTAMQGPMVKIVGHTGLKDGWEEVYANDQLEVISFINPIWKNVFVEETKWWIDSMSLESKSAKVLNNELRYTWNIDMYLDDRET